MAEDIVQSLIDRFDAKSWLEPEERDVNVLAYRYVPLRLEGKWKQARVRVRDLPARRGGLDDIVAKVPARMTDSVWASGDEDAPAVHVTTFETASRAEARAWLLRTLAEFQAPKLERTDAGEVGYISEGRAAAAFVRGNVVFFVRNAGREPTNIAPVAKGLDAELIAEPKRFTRALEVAPPRARAGKPATLELPEPEPGRYYRFVVRGGEPRLEKGRPVIVAPKGAVDVIVTLESAEGAAGNRMKLTFE